MTILTEEKENEVFKVVDDSHKLFQEGKTNESLSKMHEAWNLLPEPREATNVSNVIAGEISEMYLEDLKDYEEAIKWAKILIACYSHREIDDGEGEYTLGRIYYETEDYDKAKEQFLIRLDKTDGIGLRDAPQKYLELLKN